MTDPDAGLLARSAAGDRDAFETFVQRHHAAAVRYLKALTRSAATDDALQEAFLAAASADGATR